ncbi:MAG TPA: type II secretion system F family protein [Solirubrobacteraceae bacterium]
MVYLMFALGIVLVGVSGRLVARAVVVPRMQIKAHLREINDYGFDSIDDGILLSPTERFKQSVRELATKLGRSMMSSVPMLPALEKTEITAAGYYVISPEQVHGYRLMAAFGLPLGLFLLLAASATPMTGLPLLLLLTSIAAGWQMPAFMIRKRGTKRIDEIERALPELIDILIATIEAGLGFSAALSLVSQRMVGALGDELRLTMKQQSLGMTIQQALDGMIERVDTPSARAFVRTAGRGETLGVSIGPVLRELSSDQRRRRRQAAREKMQKAPIKMLFPMMFLIMPALMIVLMYPAAYSVAQNFNGIG